MGGGDRCHDRESEAVFVAAAGAFDGEPLEWPRESVNVVWRGITAPLLATVDVVVILIQPPGVLWRIALSMRFASRRSSSCWLPSQTARSSSA
jgi:hypothetical protein